MVQSRACAQNYRGERLGCQAGKSAAIVHGKNLGTVFSGPKEHVTFIGWVEFGLEILQLSDSKQFTNTINRL